MTVRIKHVLSSCLDAGTTFTIINDFWDPAMNTDIKYIRASLRKFFRVRSGIHCHSATAFTRGLTRMIIKFGRYARIPARVPPPGKRPRASFNGKTRLSSG